MPIDFSTIDKSIDWRQKRLELLESIRNDIQGLDWRGTPSAYTDSIAIYTDNWNDHRHNIRVALAHYGETIAQRNITHHPHSHIFPDLPGHEKWSVNGEFNSPIELVYCFDADNPPERLTKDSACGFVETTKRRWACKVQEDSP